MPGPLSFLRKNAKGAKARPPSTLSNTIKRHEGLTSQQHLPYELLIHIFSYIGDRNDIVTLCRSSKALRSIAEDFLYQSIDLNFSGTDDKARKALKLLQAIQNPRFANVVTEVRVDLQSCQQRIYTAGGEGPPKRCTCGSIDKMLGNALQSMRLLEVLSIKCFLCMNLPVGRHHYFTNLGTSHLRELRYECHCTMGNGFDTIKLFLAPWMQTVTALNWQTTLWTSIPQDKLHKLLKGRQILPNLDTLQYSGNSMSDEILAQRTIRRLSANYMDPMTTITEYPRRKALTQLIINEYYLKGFLSSVGNASQFLHLQHIGTLSFSQSLYGFMPPMADIVTSSLELIADLKRLSSIDCCVRLGKADEDPWNHQLLARLEAAHPKLCRVYLSGNYYCVWTLGGSLNIWEKRYLPAFTSWDILTGRYEKP